MNEQKGAKDNEVYSAYKIYSSGFQTLSICDESFSDLAGSSSKRERVDFLNSRNVCPNALPISGNFFGPKIIKARIKMRIKPGTPIFDSILSPQMIVN